ncbi:MAG TPA: recombinase family protein [Verrucomicrobiae bacterium]|nr:recombinase family protein [Verrucomicrobiae bacterium]
MSKHLIYCRKSTEDEDRQILSIDAQISELNAIATKEALRVVGTMTECKSAKGPGRRIFNEMLRRIETGEADSILTWKLDRLARNFEDGGRLIGMLQRGIIKEIRTFEKVYLPTDNVLMIAVELGMANQYVRDLSVNIRRGIREKVRRGIYSSRAPIGYVNDPKSRTIEPHPDFFPKVKRAMELFATSRFSLTAIQKELAACGVVGVQSKKALPLSSIGNMFRNPFYYGVFLHKGEMHQGIHAPMITKETFDRIQAALVALGKPRLRNRRGPKGFLFLNFARCGSCGYCITAEKHVKKSGRRYHYYRCTHKNKRQHCDDRAFLREEKFAEEVKRNLGLVTIPEDWKERFLAKIETWQADDDTSRQQYAAWIKGEIAILKTKIDRLNTAFTEGGIELAEFKELKNPLVAQKAGLEQKLAQAAGGGASRLELLKDWVLEANSGEKMIQEDDLPEMKSFLQKVGSNRLVRSQTLTVSFIKPWDLLAKTTVAAHAASSDSERSSGWWRRRELNPRAW